MKPLSMDLDADSNGSSSISQEDTEEAGQSFSQLFIPVTVIALLMWDKPSMTLFGRMVILGKEVVLDPGCEGVTSLTRIGGGYAAVD